MGKNNGKNLFIFRQIVIYVNTVFNNVTFKIH